ncbi:MAG: hypothetical protein IT380_27680 [Myxococcales bacterium]|nr:hypothetical protein [Myxococcales bacterium]
MKRRLGKERLFTPEERGARAIGTVPTGCPSYQARREPTAAKPTVFL